MGVRFRKSKKIVPGIKVNFGKKGIGMTVGTKGVHHTISSTGRKTTSVGVPGTGILQPMKHPLNKIITLIQ